jgi:hypothetical protein
LIRVDLQKHIADAQRHALRMPDNDFDLPHAVILAFGPKNALTVRSRSKGTAESHPLRMDAMPKYRAVVRLYEGYVQSKIGPRRGRSG